MLHFPVNAEEPLPDDFVSVAINRETVTDGGEKVEFPSGRGALPTFSAAFGKDTPPSQMKFGTPRLGPRFTTPSIEPFETPTEGRSVQSSFSAQPGSYGTASPVQIFTSASTADNQHFRSGSIASQKSYSTYKSATNSYSSRDSWSDRQRVNPFSRKWAIE